MKMTRLEKFFVNRERKSRGHIRRIRKRLEHIDRERIHSVLELGCGTGTVSAFLADTYGMEVQGIDLDPKQIALAKSKRAESDRLRFRVADTTCLSFEDASFDLVVSHFVFHHIPEWDRAVREVARVLRPGGYFIWLDLAIPRIMGRVFGPVLKNCGLYTFDEIESAFAANGLESRFFERLLYGPMFFHHLVLQKA